MATFGLKKQSIFFQMKYQFSTIFLFFALILMAHPDTIGRGSPAPALQWTAQNVSLSGHISILKEEKGDKTVAEILHDSSANKWQPYPTNYLQLGYTKSVIWLRLEIDFDEIPDEKTYWWFEISSPQDIQFYQIEKDSIQKYVHTGINFPFAQRDVLNRQAVFSFMPKKGQKTILIARFHSDVGSLIGYTYLNSASHFAEIDRKTLSIWLVIFVFMFFAALMSFGLWLAFREKIYAYYGAYLICGMMLFISVNGFGYEWFWPNSPVLANATKVVWSFALMGFLLVFVYRLLFEVVKNDNIFKRCIQIITGLLIAEILFSLNYHHFPLPVLPIMLRLANFTLFSAILFILLMLGIGVYKRYTPAYYFLFAFLPIAITVILIILRNAGWLQSTLLQSPFMAIPAFCIEIILLFLALLKRFQTLLKNQQAQLQMELESQIRLQDERERISRDLHDNVGAQLSYIITNIDHIVETQNKDESRLEDVAETAKKAILNLRETIWAINNEQITVEDFYDRFKLYATNQVKNRSDIHLIFSENIVQNHILNPNQALNLYRICQEALTNALKYANAKNLEICIHANDKPYFQFQLKDDGIGFDLAQNTEGGYGLKNMKARAYEIGADFRLFSEKGRGTTIDITLEKPNLEQIK
jgi:two-component system, sensor histidine kinase LadS